MAGAGSLRAGQGEEQGCVCFPGDALLPLALFKGGVFFEF